MTRGGKWALVTGAAQRIGRAIALELAEGGWNIVVHYNASHDEALKTAREIAALGRRAVLAELDLADLPRAKKLVPALVKELGPIGALINNASVFEPDNRDKDNLHARVNLNAPWILSEAFYRQTKGRGAIVNLLDADPPQRFSLYAASKENLRRLTLEMALFYAPHVRVNGVALGPVLPAARQSQDHFRKRVQRTPLGKTIPPEAVARTVRFLVEEDSITGAVIPLDGGMHLTRS